MSTPFCVLKCELRRRSQDVPAWEGAEYFAGFGGEDLLPAVPEGSLSAGDQELATGSTPNSSNRAPGKPPL